MLASAGLLILAGCSKGRDEAAEAPTEVVDTVQPASEAAAGAARSAPDAAEGETPDIGQTVVPGVSFAYRYSFTLPAKAIAGVQQRHAAACERLGSARCQVVGVSYDQPRKDEVSARLDLMLAPEIAHGFGSDAIAAVERADGSVDTASIDGDNAGGAIDQSQRRSTALRAQLSRIEKRLTAPGVSTEEKNQLSQRAVDLRQQLGNEQEVRQEKEASLATTPMSFAYGTEGVFGASDPFGNAASNSLGSLQALFAFLLTAAGLLLPWLLLGALVVLLLRFRAMKRRLAQATGGAADSAPPQ